jgi:uncharacterized protein
LDRYCTWLLYLDNWGSWLLFTFYTPDRLLVLQSQPVSRSFQKINQGETIMSQIELLYRLQQIDDELRQKKKRLGEVLRAQKGSETLRAAHEMAAEATAVWQQSHTRHTDLDLELKSLIEKAGASEERLYSGKVKNPKELADLQQEIEALNRRRATLEEEVLGAMMALEEAETARVATGEHLAKIEAEWQRQTAAWQQEQLELARRANELGGLREQQIRHIAPAALAVYDDASRRHNGLAVVNLKSNMCQGCQVSVSVNITKSANEGQLARCGNCGRLLRLV